MKAFYKLTALVICMLSLGTATSAQQIFLKITDQSGNVLVGSSIQTGFTQQVEALAIGQESSACPNTFTNPSCTPVTGNFVLNIYPDQTITDFRKALYLRLKWQKVEISVVGTAATNPGYYTMQKITLTDLYITKLTDNITSGGGFPTFQVSFDPTSIIWTWTQLNSQGTPGTPRSFTWNRQTNSGN